MPALLETSQASFPQASKVRAGTELLETLQAAVERNEKERLYRVLSFRLSAVRRPMQIRFVVNRVSRDTWRIWWAEVKIQSKERVEMRGNGHVLF